MVDTVEFKHVVGTGVSFPVLDEFSASFIEYDKRMESITSWAVHRVLYLYYDGLRPAIS